MSIIRVPYQPKRYKGALDNLVAHYLLDKYFEAGQAVLDPMAGSNTVQREAIKLGIFSYNNDIMYPDGWDVTKPWPYTGPPQFHGIILHPPYFRAKKYVREPKFHVETLSAESELIMKDDKRDIGNIEDYDEYIDAIAGILTEAKKYTIPGGYIILVIGDYRKKGRIRLVHADIYKRAEDIGLLLENYDLWEISATGTPFVSVKHMIMINWCMAFIRPHQMLEEFLDGNEHGP